MFVIRIERSRKACAHFPMGILYKELFTIWKIEWRQQKTWNNFFPHKFLIIKWNIQVDLHSFNGTFDKFCDHLCHYRYFLWRLLMKGSIKSHSITFSTKFTHKSFHRAEKKKQMRETYINRFSWQAINFPFPRKSRNVLLELWFHANDVAFGRIFCLGCPLTWLVIWKNEMGSDIFGRKGEYENLKH